MFKKQMTSPAMRRRVSLILAFVLIPPFIIFFHSFTGKSPIESREDIAGTIFGKPIDLEAFRQYERWIRQRLSMQFGENLSPESSATIRKLTWNHVLLLVEAKRRHMRINDKTLAAFIEGLPAFQDGGRFSRARYTRYVSLMGFSPRAFEESVRDDLLVQQLQESVRSQVYITDEELKTAYRQRAERLRAEMILVEPARFMETMRGLITDDEIQTYYEAHLEEFARPEEITVSYIGRTRSQLSNTITVSEEEIAEYYDERQDEFTNEQGSIRPLDEVREEIRQRLIDRKVKRQLVGLAVDLEEALSMKESLEEAAAVYALKIETFGPVSRESLASPGGIPDPALLKAAFKLKRGALSKVIETDEGVYVARVAQRKARHTAPLEEIRDSVFNRLAQVKAREAAALTADQLYSAMSKKLGEGIEFADVCDGLHLTPISPKPFTRTEPIATLGRLPQLNSAAFEATVGSLLKPIETPKGFVIVYPKEQIAADPSGFEEEKEKLRKELLESKRRSHLSKWLSDLQERAQLKSFLDIPSS